MKNKANPPTTIPPAAAPAAAPSPESKPKTVRTPDPALDHKTAKPVPPYRHEKSGRTVGHHQVVDETTVHLFSPTGNFIETISTEEAAKAEPQPVKQPDPAPAAVAEIPTTESAPAAPEAPAAS